MNTIFRSLPIEDLCTEIKTIFADFIQENLHLAAQQISETGRLKIKDGQSSDLSKILVERGEGGVLELISYQNK